MTLFILPVFNEEWNIVNTIETLLNWCNENLPKNYNILFIDDNSTDSTFATIKSIDGVSVYRNVFDKGKGSALKAGYVYSSFLYKIKDNDTIIFLDGDGQIEPKEVSTMMNVMALYNSDVVIGNKRHLYSHTHYSLLRNIISRTYNLMVRMMFGFDYRDTQGGLKIFKKSALDAVIHKVTNKKYAFDVELIVALRKSVLRVADAPIHVKTATNAGSVSLINIIKTFIDTIIICYNYLKGIYNAD
jgi:glycosyltransferase involved in cell wall biosynthesis